MSRVIRALSVGLHPEAACDDCPKQWGSSPLTREHAKQHAKETGHTVEVVTSTVDKYRREAP